METTLIEKKFENIGARVKFSEPNRFNSLSFSIDIRKDKEGEYFDIRIEKEIQMMVLDAQKNDRHLLLLVRNPDEKRNPNSKFLCGHDERAWFTCAIPSVRGIPVSTVPQAKQALKPKEIIEAEIKGGVKAKNLQKRRRKLSSGGKIVRQGEFMFIPQPDMVVKESSLNVIHRNEPMRRGRVGNSHYAEYLYRYGGEKVYTNGSHHNGLTEDEYQKYIKENPTETKRNWTVMMRNPKAFVKGRITHKEHRTVDLKDTWHLVCLNTENLAPGARNVAFID